VATPQHHVKDSVYALEDPTVPGLYIRLDGDRPLLKRLPQACLAPATRAGCAAIARHAVQRLAGTGVLYELVRVDA